MCANEISTLDEELRILKDDWTMTISYEKIIISNKSGEIQNFSTLNDFYEAVSTLYKGTASNDLCYFAGIINSAFTLQNKYKELVHHCIIPETTYKHFKPINDDDGNPWSDVDKSLEEAIKNLPFSGSFGPLNDNTFDDPSLLFLRDIDVFFIDRLDENDRIKFFKKLFPRVDKGGEIERMNPVEYICKKYGKNESHFSRIRTMFNELITCQTSVSEEISSTANYFLMTETRIVIYESITLIYWDIKRRLNSVYGNRCPPNYHQIIFCDKNTKFSEIQKWHEKKRGNDALFILFPEYLDAEEFTEFMEFIRPRLSISSTPDNYVMVLTSLEKNKFPETDRPHIFEEANTRYITEKIDNNLNKVNIRVVMSSLAGCGKTKYIHDRAGDFPAEFFITQDYQHVPNLSLVESDNIIFNIVPEIYQNSNSFWTEMFMLLTYGFAIPTCDKSMPQLVSLDERTCLWFEIPFSGGFEKIYHFPLPLSNTKESVILIKPEKFKENTIIHDPRLKDTNKPKVYSNICEKTIQYDAKEIGTIIKSIKIEVTGAVSDYSKIEGLFKELFGKNMPNISYQKIRNIEKYVATFMAYIPDVSDNEKIGWYVVLFMSAFYVCGVVQDLEKGITIFVPTNVFALNPSTMSATIYTTIDDGKIFKNTSLSVLQGSVEKYIKVIGKNRLDQYEMLIAAMRFITDDTDFINNIVLTKVMELSYPSLTKNLHDMGLEDIRDDSVMAKKILEHKDAPEFIRIIAELCGNNPLNYCYRFAMHLKLDFVKRTSISVPVFLRMITILSSIKAHIAFCLSGEAGVGKTSMIDILKEVNAMLNEMKLKTCLPQIHHITVHPGTTKKDIDKEFNDDENIFVFFDEANTSPLFSYIASKLVRAGNDNEQLLVCAATNPYCKMGEAARIFSRSGMKQVIEKQDYCKPMAPIYEDSAVDMSQLKYFVQFSTSSIDNITICCNPMGMENDKKKFLKDEEISNIEHIIIIRNIFNKIPEREKYVKLLTNLLCAGIKFSREFADENAVCSYRTVVFFIEIFLYIRDSIKSCDAASYNEALMISLYIIFAAPLPEHFFITDGAIRVHMKRCGLSIEKDPDTGNYFSNPRKGVLEAIAGVWKASGITADVIRERFVKYSYYKTWDMIMPEKKYWKMDALAEHTLMIKLCIEKRLNGFIIGYPATCKSMSTKVIAEKYKDLDISTYMCTRNASSESLLMLYKDVGRKALEKLGNFLIVIEEIGIANQAKSNPLKVLHELLEKGVLINGVYKKIPTIAISNYAIDYSNRSRCVSIYTEIFTKKELIESFSLDKSAKEFGPIGSISYKDFDSIYKSFRRDKSKQDPVVVNFFKALWDDKNKQPASLALRSIYTMFKIVSKLLNQEENRIDLDLCHLALELTNARRLLFKDANKPGNRCVIDISSPGKAKCANIMKELKEFLVKFDKFMRNEKLYDNELDDPFKLRDEEDDYEKAYDLTNYEVVFDKRIIDKGNKSICIVTKNYEILEEIARNDLCRDSISFARNFRANENKDAIIFTKAILQNSNSTSNNFNLLVGPGIGTDSLLDLTNGNDESNEAFICIGHHTVKVKIGMNADEKEKEEVAVIAKRPKLVVVLNLNDLNETGTARSFPEPTLTRFETIYIDGEMRRYKNDMESIDKIFDSNKKGAIVMTNSNLKDDNVLFNENMSFDILVNEISSIDDFKKKCDDIYSKISAIRNKKVAIFVKFAKFDRDALASVILSVERNGRADTDVKFINILYQLEKEEVEEIGSHNYWPTFIIDDISHHVQFNGTPQLVDQGKMVSKCIEDIRKNGNCHKRNIIDEKIKNPQDIFKFYDDSQEEFKKILQNKRYNQSKYDCLMSFIFHFISENYYNIICALYTYIGAVPKEVKDLIAKVIGLKIDGKRLDVNGMIGRRNASNEQKSTVHDMLLSQAYNKIIHDYESNKDISMTEDDDKVSEEVVNTLLNDSDFKEAFIECYKKDYSRIIIEGSNSYSEILKNFRVMPGFNMCFAFNNSNANDNDGPINKYIKKVIISSFLGEKEHIDINFPKFDVDKSVVDFNFGDLNVKDVSEQYKFDEKYSSEFNEKFQKIPDLGGKSLLQIIRDFFISENEFNDEDVIYKRLIGSRVPLVVQLVHSFLKGESWAKDDLTNVLSPEYEPKYKERSERFRDIFLTHITSHVSEIKSLEDLRKMCCRFFMRNNKLYTIPRYETSKIKLCSEKTSIEAYIFTRLAYGSDSSQTLFDFFIWKCDFIKEYNWFSTLLSFVFDLKYTILCNKSQYKLEPAQRAYMYMACTSPIKEDFPGFEIFETSQIASNYKSVEKIPHSFNNPRAFAGKNPIHAIISEYINDFIEKHNKVADELIAFLREKKIKVECETIEFTHFIPMMSLTNFFEGEMTDSPLNETFCVAKLVNPFKDGNRNDFGLTQKEIDEMLKNARAKLDSTLCGKKKVVCNKQSDSYNSLLFHLLVKQENINQGGNYLFKQLSMKSSKYNEFDKFVEKNDYLKAFLNQ